MRRVQYQQGSSQRGNRHRAHVDPIRRRQIAGRKAEERIAVEDQRHHPDIEHAAPQPHGQGHEVELEPIGLVDARSKQRRGHGQGLRRHHRQQPAAVDTLVESGLFALDGESREDRVGQADPQNNGQRPQSRARSNVFTQDHELARQDARAGHRRKIARSGKVSDHVAEKPPWIAPSPQGIEQP